VTIAFVTGFPTLGLVARAHTEGECGVDHDRHPAGRCAPTRASEAPRSRCQPSRGQALGAVDKRSRGAGLREGRGRPQPQSQDRPRSAPTKRYACLKICTLGIVRPTLRMVIPIHLPPRSSSRRAARTGKSMVGISRVSAIPQIEGERLR
jgi:hypothetical protein